MSIDLKIVTQLEQRAVREAAAQLNKEFKDRKVEVGADVKAAEIKAAAERIKREFADIRAEVKVDVDRSAIRGATRDFRELDRGMTDIDDTMKSVGKSSFQLQRGFVTLAAAPVVAFLAETASVAVTASQSIALLPAGLTAAAAGFGTLKIATAGFSQAMKDLGDIDKFTADLAKLTPNAQEAALVIRNQLIPELQNLQKATESAFFQGFGQRIQDLQRSFAPGLQNLTTSIADSLNQGLMGITGQLLSGRGQGQIGEIFDNISAAFENAAPAAANFSDALLTITKAGSDALPGLASSLTTVTGQFADFIDQASRSGQLDEWINQGIDAAKGLAGAVKDVGTAIFDVFGGTSQANIDAWRNQITDSLTSIETLVWPITNAFKVLNTTIGDTNFSISSLLNPLTLVKDLWDSVKNQAFPTLRIDPRYARDNPRGFGNAPSAGDLIFPQGRPLPDLPPGVGGLLNAPDITNVWGNPSPYGFKNPALTPAKGAKGAKPSDRDRLDALRAGLDPSLYKVDPFAGMPPLGTALSPQELQKEQFDVISAAHDLEESRKDRLALEKDNESTAEQISDAKWKEVEDGQKLVEAQNDLVTKSRGTAKKLKAGFEELGAGLDQDLGISKGLAGLADNLVRFLGALAAAPIMGPLSALKSGLPSQGGSGILGMMAAGGAFGPQFTVAGQGDVNATTGGSTGYSQYGSNLSLGQLGLSGIPGIPGTGTGTGTGTGASASALGLGALLSTGGGTGGGSGGLAASLYQDKSGAWHSTLPEWEHLIQRESGGNPTIPNLTDSNYIAGHPSKGLFQFTDPTWISAGGGKYAPSAALATPQQQAEIAANLLRMNPSGSDWGAGLTGRENAGRLLAELGSGSTAAPSAPPAPAPRPTPTPGNPYANLAPLLPPITPQKTPNPFYGGTPAAAPPSAGGGWFTPGGSSAGPVPSLLSPGAAVPSNMPWLKYIPGFDDGGGVVPPPPMGAAPPPPGPDTVPAMLQPGEHVLDTQDVAAMGGQQGVYDFRNALHATTPFTPSLGAGMGPTKIGGLAPHPGQGSGFGITGGGLIGLAESLPSTAAEMAIQAAAGAGHHKGGAIKRFQEGGAVGGAGGGSGGAAGSIISAAINIGMQEMNRAIGYAGQVAGIGVSGLMETFLPTGGSELANNNWLTRIAGGIVGARPSLSTPGTGGALGEAQMQGAVNPITQQLPTMAPGALTPEMVAANNNIHGMSGGAQPGPVVGVLNYNNVGATEDAAGRDIAHNLGAMNAAGAAGMGGPPR